MLLKDAGRREMVKGRHNYESTIFSNVLLVYDIMIFGKVSLREVKNQNDILDIYYKVTSYVFTIFLGKVCLGMNENISYGNSIGLFVPYAYTDHPHLIFL